MLKFTNADITIGKHTLGFSTFTGTVLGRQAEPCDINDDSESRAAIVSAGAVVLMDHLGEQTEVEIEGYAPLTGENHTLIFACLKGQDSKLPVATVNLDTGVITQFERCLISTEGTELLNSNPYAVRVTGIATGCVFAYYGHVFFNNLVVTLSTLAIATVITELGAKHLINLNEQAQKCALSKHIDKLGKSVIDAFERVDKIGPK